MASNKLDELKKNPQIQCIVEEWKKLNEKEREMLIPYLLYSLGGWKAWAIMEHSVMGWLKRKFEDAGVPFIESVHSPEREKYRALTL